MQVRKPIALLAIGMVAVFGVMAGAQAAKPTAKAKKPRVFFVEPMNGATVTSPVHMKFGSAGIEISPVPPGDLTSSRKGMAHYHVTIDQT